MARASVCFLSLFIFISVFTPYTDGSVLMLGQQTSVTGTEGSHNEAIDVCLSQGMGLLIFETNSDWSAMCKLRLDDVKQRNPMRPSTFWFQSFPTQILLGWVQV